MSPMPRVEGGGAANRRARPALPLRLGPGHRRRDARRAREIRGFEADAALTSTDLFARIHPQDRSRVRAELAAACEVLSPLATDCHIARPDGTIRPVGSLAAGRAGLGGLRLARQPSGEMGITSEVGRGTTTCLSLPCHLGHPDKREAAPEEAGALAGTDAVGGTVLVIDDEPVVRMLIDGALEELGCAVREAADGPEGLEAALRSAARIDLLVTDMGLPGGLDGRQVADTARALRPNLPVLFVTGYAENAALDQGRLAPGMQVISRTSDMNETGHRVRALLAG